MVYGYHQHDFSQAKRGGGWRPTVFMQHGLAVATFMCTATLMATWVAISEKRRTVLGLPLWLFALVMFATAVLCKSSGATLLMLAGLTTLLFIRTTRLTIPAWALLGVPFIYMLARTIGGWDASIIKDLARAISDRAFDSIQYRLGNEDALWLGVRPRLLLGATRFFWTEIDPEVGRRIVPDGLWILALGRFGIVGVASLFVSFAIPSALFLRRFGAAQWTHPMVATGAGWAMCLALWAVDCLSNAMVDPIFLLAAGGLAAAPALVAAPMPGSRGRLPRMPQRPMSVINLRARDGTPPGSIIAALPERPTPPATPHP
jgi:hypothetical protein